MVLSAFGMTAMAEETHKIGILAPATTHGWVGGVTYFAQQAADESGVDYTLLTSSNADEMSSQIEQLMQQGVEAIRRVAPVHRRGDRRGDGARAGHHHLQLRPDHRRG